MYREQEENTTLTRIFIKKEVGYPRKKKKKKNMNFHIGA